MILASEPIDDCASWAKVAPGSFVALRDGNITIEPFKPEFSDSVLSAMAAS